jgi:hypothetical protein
MAVSIIENWTDLEGRVQALSPSTDVAQYVVAEVLVRRTQAVEGFPNLLAAAAGTVVQVHIATDVAKKAGVAVGVQIRCRVRRGGPQKVFSHPTEIRVG